MKNIRSSQPCISMNFCTEFSKVYKFFHASIAKKVIKFIHENATNPKIIEMVVLKVFELSVNIESISFQTKVQHVHLWLAITKPYFKNDNFEVYAEKKLKNKYVLSLEQKVNPTRKFIQ